MKTEKGNTVSVHYTGTLNDGTEFDSSHNRGEPITFEVGSGQMIGGFDAAVVGMSVGETKEIEIQPDGAYGSRDESQVQPVPKTAFPPDFDFTPGSMVQAAQGEKTFYAKIVENDEESVVLDFNHPLAGKTLNFKIEMVDIS